MKSKTRIIIQREYFTRVKKPSFWVMSVLPPILFAGLFALIIWLALKDTSVSRVAVINESPIYKAEDFRDTKYVTYDYIVGKKESDAKKLLYETDYTAVMWIPGGEYSVLGHGVNLYYRKNPGIIVEGTIKSNLENVLYLYILENDSIDPRKVADARKAIPLKTMAIDENGREKKMSAEVNIVIGYVGSILIYLFIFLYGVQVMRGVIEEKTNRIVETIVSSVRPFQLMVGKIAGVSLVGLTQLALWVLLSLLLAGVLNMTILSDPGLISKKVVPTEQVIKMGVNVSDFDLTAKGRTGDGSEWAKIMDSLKDQNFPLLVGCFLFYFLAGYLLYGALFAALGSAVDSETDVQQFMLPVSLPLIMGFVAAQMVTQNPEGSLGFWLSIIPFTSPVVMMVRVPFGVPWWELALSMALLVATFMFVTWLAGKIYRTGILMYGKKVTWKELWKWLFYTA